MNKVELTYNPYQSRTLILINGHPISPYSEVAKYLTEPFHMWGDRIFNGISREINDDYTLFFTSRGFEAEILDNISKNQPGCLGVHHENCSIDLTLYERFRLLEEMLAGQIDKKEISVLFYTDGSIDLNQIKDSLLNIYMFYDNDGQYFTDDYPMCHITAHFKECRWDEIDDSGDLAVVFCQGEVEDSVLRYLQEVDNNFYIFSKNTMAHASKTDNLYFFSFDEQNLAETLLNVIEYQALTPLLAELLLVTRGRLQNDDIFLNETEIEELVLLDSIEPLIEVSCDSILTAGRTYPLSINCYPRDSRPPEVFFEYSRDGVVICSGGRIKALAAGEVYVNVYRVGSVEPICRFDVSVIRKNLIDSLQFSQDRFEVGLGDEVSLQFTCFPENPDNLDELTWFSSNPEIASFDWSGTVTAHSIGQCEITLSTREVSASCLLQIRPRITDIELPTGYLSIDAGNKQQLIYKVIPEDAIDADSVKTWCSNPGVVTYDSGLVKAVAPGEAKIVIYTPDNRISRTCKVTVKSRKGLF